MRIATLCHQLKEGKFITLVEENFSTIPVQLKKGIQLGKVLFVDLWPVEDVILSVKLLAWGVRNIKSSSWIKYPVLRKRMTQLLEKLRIESEHNESR